jgi:hypothetical protein
VVNILHLFGIRSEYYRSVGYDIEGLVDETIAEVQQAFNQYEAAPCDSFAYNYDGARFSILDVCDTSRVVSLQLIGAACLFDTSSVCWSY